MSEYYAVRYSDSLSHHGIKGMRWGIRRFQNEDGSLTADGRKRYSLGERLHKLNSKRLMSAAKAADRDAAYLRKHGYKEEASAVQKVADRNRAKANKPYKKMTDEQKAKLKKGLLIAAAVAGTAAVAYAGHKYMQNTKALKTLMRDANSDIKLGKSMVENLRKQSFADSAAAAKAGIDYGLNPVTSKSISYLGNDLKQHTASYDVYARRTMNTGNQLNVGKTFVNPGVSTQKEFATLEEYKKARKAAGLGNYVIGRRK